jgi:hypothetical protein
MAWYIECNRCGVRHRVGAEPAMPVTWLKAGKEHYCEKCTEKQISKSDRGATSGTPAPSANRTTASAGIDDLGQEVGR